MKKPFHGWAGRILHVDLHTNTVETEHPKQQFLQQTLGGRALGMHYLMPHGHESWGLPAMPVIISTGPLTGTGIPMAHTGRITSRSPLTGTVGDDSLTGFFPAHLKRAGYDALVIKGHAPGPCGLVICNGHVELVDASALIDMETGPLFDYMESHYNSTAGLCIGPAASHSLLAAVVTDRHHVTGRGGLGRCLGIKNLRFIAVRGTIPPSIHSPALFQQAKTDIARLMAASPSLMGPYGVQQWGTAAFLDLTHTRRIMPTDNFRRTFFARSRRVNAPTMAKPGPLQSVNGPDCPAQHVKIVADGRVLPDFDSLSHFTALLGNPDPDMALDYFFLCTQMGLEPISTAATLACNQEISGQHYGRAELSKALRNMAADSSLGHGSARFARQCGVPESAMTVKNLELPAIDPRGAMGTALAYAVSTQGGSYARAFPLSHEILRKPVATDRFSFAGKARMVKLAEDAIAGVESLGICQLGLLAVGLEEYAHAVQGVTGLNITARDIATAGERTTLLERSMNADNGFDEQTDDLPGHFFTDPGTAGPDWETPPINRDDFIAARTAYYAIRGLTSEGRPTPEKQEELGMDKKASTGNRP